MAYDEDLAGRLRECLEQQSGVTETRMFGGLAFLVNGHMAVAAASHGGLLLRIDPARSDELLDKPEAEPFVMRGRAMEGWLRVETAGMDDAATLRWWVEHGVRYARGLPPKKQRTAGR